MTSQANQRDVLSALGYEVTGGVEGAGGRVIHAYKARGQSLAYNLVIDASGQVRLTATRLLQPAQAMQVQHAKRPYRVTREQQSITTIMYELRASDDLADVVREMEQAASGA